MPKGDMARSHCSVLNTSFKSEENKDIHCTIYMIFQLSDSKSIFDFINNGA